MEKVSVIIPVYNVEKYIKICIESVLVQTYALIEVILVDDGSTDGCPAICDAYAKCDDRVQVIHKKNGGLSDARNAGIRVATGEYIMFVDSDDYIAPNMVEKLYEKAKENDADMVLCQFSIIDEAGEELQRNARPIDGGVWPEEKFWNCYYNGDTVFCVVAWNKIYKRELFRDIQYDVGKYHEDEFMLNKLVENCRFVDMLEDKLYFYRQRIGSITDSEDPVRRMDRIEAWLVRCESAVNDKKYWLAEPTLLLVFEEMLSLYDQIDFQNADIKNCYRMLKKFFKKEYFSFYFCRHGGVCSAKMLLYLFHERCYFALRKIFHCGEK